MAAFATTAQSEQPADVFSVTTCSYPSAQCGRVQCNSSGRTERGRARSHGCRARSQLREGPRGPVARSALRDCALRPHEARRRPSREVLLRPQTSAATSSCVQDPFVLRIAPECPKARDMPEEQVEACAESFISDLLADAMNDFVDEQVYDLADDPVDGGSTYGLAEPVINAGEPMILECEEGQEMEWPAYIPAMMPLGAPVCDSPMWSQSGCCGDIDYSCGIKADVALQTGGGGDGSSSAGVGIGGGGSSGSSGSSGSNGSAGCGRNGRSGRGGGSSGENDCEECDFEDVLSFCSSEDSWDERDNELEAMQCVGIAVNFAKTVVEDGVHASIFDAIQIDVETDEFQEFQVEDDEGNSIAESKESEDMFTAGYASMWEHNQNAGGFAHDENEESDVSSDEEDEEDNEGPELVQESLQPQKEWILDYVCGLLDAALSGSLTNPTEKEEEEEDQDSTGLTVLGNFASCRPDNVQDMSSDETLPAACALAPCTRSGFQRKLYHRGGRPPVQSEPFPMDCLPSQPLLLPMTGSSCVDWALLRKAVAGPVSGASSSRATLIAKPQTGSITHTKPSAESLAEHSMQQQCAALTPSFPSRAVRTSKSKRRIIGGVIRPPTPAIDVLSNSKIQPPPSSFPHMKGLVSHSLKAESSMWRHDKSSPPLPAGPPPNVQWPQKHAGFRAQIPAYRMDLEDTSPTRDPDPCRDARESSLARHYDALDSKLYSIQDESDSEHLASWNVYPKFPSESQLWRRDGRTLLSSLQSKVGERSTSSTCNGGSKPRARLRAASAMALDLGRHDNSSVPSAAEPSVLPLTRSMVSVDLKRSLSQGALKVSKSRPTPGILPELSVKPGRSKSIASSMHMAHIALKSNGTTSVF